MTAPGPAVGTSPTKTVELPTWEAIEAARRAIAGTAIATPVVALPARGAGTLHVKLENLQPTGSFKIRGATSALALRRAREEGPLVTVSAGNTGRAVAYLAARVGRPCVVYVPDHAPAAKLEPMRRLGATIEPMPFEQWWRIAQSPTSPRADAVFIHPFLDPGFIAGNATIGAELEGGDPYDAVLVPWGGGGLTLGIATALRTVAPSTKIYAVEVSSAAPLSAAWSAGAGITVDYQPTFVDGIGSTSVVGSLWEHAKRMLSGVVTVTAEQAAEGLRLAAREAHVIVEGAAGCAIAAAALPEFRDHHVLAIASGGNIDAEKLARILEGALP